MARVLGSDSKAKPSDENSKGRGADMTMIKPSAMSAKKIIMSMIQINSRGFL